MDRTMRFALVVLLGCSLAQCNLPATAYQTDAASHLLTVSPAADAVATTKDIQSALSILANRTDKSTLWTLRFAPGRYTIANQLYSVGLDNVNLVSDPKSPAILSKAANWSIATGDYLLYVRMSKNLSVSGFTFYGLTDFSKGSDANWGDSGLIFASTDNVTVENNRFYNFGNGALRITTYDKDPVSGVNSFNSKVLNNYFENIYQIATTSNDTSSNHGGTANMLVQGNTFVNLRGSVKAASRTPGCKNIRYINNTIRNGDHYGFEIASCSDVTISGNTLDNIASVAIDLYTNANTAQGFPWGDNTLIEKNTIRNSGRGIRFSAEPYANGFSYAPSNLVIKNNVLSGITLPDPSIGAISVPNGAVNGAQITSNQFENVINKNYIAINQKASAATTLLGNLAGGLAFGPQPAASSPASAPTPSEPQKTSPFIPISNTPAPVATAPAVTAPGATAPTATPPAASSAKPNAPSSLITTLQGQQSLKLAWTDNADNETSQQIWTSSDATHYTKLTDVDKDVTTFSQKLSPYPAGKTVYYAVRALNANGASGFSKTKITFPDAPSSPANLTAQYNTEQNAVQLTWTDNANDETSQQIWFGTDGSHYSLLTKLPANATSYTHQITAKPDTGRYYYVVRAVNEYGSSAFSKAATVNIPSK